MSNLPFVPVKCWVADVAWQYNDRKEFRKDNPEKKAKAGVGAGGHYRLSPIKELLELGPLIQMCSAGDSLMNFWVTGPVLTQSLLEENVIGQILDSWGFVPKFIETVWVKTQKSQQLLKDLQKQGHPAGETRQKIHLRQMLNGELNSTLFEKNMGFYVPGNVEIRLGCVRGKPIHTNKGFKKPCQVVESPEGCLGLFEEDGEAMAVFDSPVLYHSNLEHSVKPQCTLDRLTNWLGPFLKPGEFCEIFSRRQSPGWHCYGNEITGNLLDFDLEQHARKIYGTAAVK